MPEELTPSAIWTAIGVFVGLLLLFAIVVTAVEKWRVLRKPRQDAANEMDDRLTAIEDKLKNDKARLDGIDRRLSLIDRDTEDIYKGFGAVCKALSALLEHELHNGNADQMQAASYALNDYLTSRPRYGGKEGD